jgi:spermidine synthase
MSVDEVRTADREPDDVRAGIRHEWALAWLLPLFFVSGATALTYQTLWVGQLQLVFGTSTFAISTVLATFMGGLGLGGLVGGRFADRIARPLRVYGLLEIGIGLFALLFPVLIRLETPLYMAAGRSLASGGPVVYGLFQFVLVGVLLVAPTAMMGATLPLLARFATRRLGGAGDDVGTLYAVNTAGAVLGTALCGFVLLPGTGRFTTTLLAAAANLILGIGALALDARVRGRERVTDDLHAAAPVAAALPFVTAAIALAGFSALVYEVAWTRVLGLMLGASTYTFSVMLLAFLVGIAIGGKLGGPLADRLMRDGGVNRVLLAFAGIEVGIAVLSYALMYVYPEMPFLYVRLFDWLNGDERPQAVWAVSLLLAGLIMTPPAVLMGLHFPIAVRAAIGRPDELGAPVGRIYGANTIGGVAGAFLAGFVLLPTIRVQGTMLVAAVVELAAAGLLIAYVARSERRSGLLAAPLGMVGLLLVFAAQRPPWDPMLMTAGMYHYVSHFSDHSRQGVLDFTISQYELLFYEEGLSSVVTVAKNRSSDNVWLANNGKVDASTTTDLPTQILCSLLPMQFAEDPEEVMVIGLASGISAGALTQVEAIDRLDIVELEPAIRRASEFFKDYNHNVLEDPRVNLIVNDGRNQVLLTEPGTYDVIVSEPPNPWITGVSNLFTKEFYELGKTRLQPGGVWSQWVQLYGMDTHDLRMLLRTFAEVYPHVLVYSIEDVDLILIGSDAPLSPSPDAAARLFQWKGVVNDLGKVDVLGPTTIVSLFQMDRDGILQMAGDIGFNTDDNMAIEYSAPLNLHEDTTDANLELLAHYASLPKDAMPPDPSMWGYLGGLYYDQGDLGRAVASTAIAVSLLPDDDPRREGMLDSIREWKAEAEGADEDEDQDEDEDG